MTSTSETQQCPAEDIAAYLDGELDAEARDSFEAHSTTCDVCAGELLRQRQLLCTLDAAFLGNEMGLPQNFARVVAKHAETDMRGMRDGFERRQALRLALILAIAAFALLGSASAAAVWEPARTIARLVRIFGVFLWDAIYQAGAGLSVILRMLTRSFVFESRPLGLLILLLFGAALALLPRLIARYHRAEIAE
jgi:hypothetical protein